MRVMVVGTSGSGKTTFARRLAKVLDVPHIELDAINWQPGWRDLTTHDPAEFDRRVEAAASDDGWVTDGSYGRVWPILARRAHHIVWIDYSRAVVMRRVIWRSLVRAIGGKELWPGTGNRETFTRWLDKGHPIRWAWDTWAQRRARYPAMFERLENPKPLVHRLSHPREGAALIARLGRG